jgi:hypothetical protein
MTGNVTQSPDVCARLFRGGVARGLGYSLENSHKPFIFNPDVAPIFVVRCDSRTMNNSYRSTTMGSMAKGTLSTEKGGCGQLQLGRGPRAMQARESAIYAGHGILCSVAGAGGAPGAFRD